MRDLFGGSLLFGMAYKGNSKAVGIFEDINAGLLIRLLSALQDNS